MAAICLIDMEVAQFPEIHTLFRKNPLLGGVYPVAAYNGGPRNAKALYADIRSGRLVLTGFTAADNCPCGMKQGKPQAVSKKKKKKITISQLNAETRGYVKKYVAILNYVIENDIIEAYVK